MVNEDIGLQLEMLRIQVRQQHISTLYSMMLSVEMSITTSILVFYAGLYFYFNNPLFGLLTLLSLAFLPVIALTWHLYKKALENFSVPNVLRKTFHSLLVQV